MKRILLLGSGTATIIIAWSLGLVPDGHQATTRPSPDAVTAAARFTVAWWTYDWRDTAALRSARLRPLVAQPWSGLLVNDAAPDLEQAELLQHRHVTVGAPSVVLQDRSSTGVGLAVTAPVTVSTSTATAVLQRWAMEILLVPSGRTWLVAAVDQ